MTSNLKTKIHRHFSVFTNLSGKDETMSFVHAMAQLYPDDVTPVGGHYGAIGHWWLEGSNGEVIDPFNSTRDWPYDTHRRGVKELEKAINQHVFAEHIREHSEDILATVANQNNELTYEAKIGEADDYDEDFEDGFDFVDDEEPQLKGFQP